MKLAARFGHIFSTFLDGCTFDNWRHIKEGRRFITKFYWIIIQLGTIGVSIYFVYNSVAEYMKHDATTKISVDLRNDEVPFPSVTFCRANPFKKDELAKNMTLLSMMYNVAKDLLESQAKAMDFIHNEVSPVFPDSEHPDLNQWRCVWAQLPTGQTPKQDPETCQAISECLEYPHLPFSQGKSLTPRIWIRDTNPGPIPNFLPGDAPNIPDIIKCVNDKLPKIQVTGTPNGGGVSVTCPTGQCPPASQSIPVTNPIPISNSIGTIQTPVGTTNMVKSNTGTGQTTVVSNSPFVTSGTNGMLQFSSSSQTSIPAVTVASVVIKSGSTMSYTCQTGGTCTQTQAPSPSSTPGFDLSSVDVDLVTIDCDSESTTIATTTTTTQTTTTTSMHFDDFVEVTCSVVSTSAPLSSSSGPTTTTSTPTIPITTTTTTLPTTPIPTSSPPIPQKKTDQLSVTTKAESSVAYYMAGMTPAQIAKLSYGVHEVVKSCKFNGKSCNLETADSSGGGDVCNFVSAMVGLCYIYNYANCRTCSDSASNHPCYCNRTTTRLTVTFKVDSDKAPKFVTKDGIRMMITMPGELILPSSMGFTVSAGYLYNIAVNFININRITGCIDRNIEQLDPSIPFYYKDVKYSSEGCFESCRQRQIYSKCNCSNPSVEAKECWMSSCTIETKDCVDEIYMNELLIDECHEICKPACQEFMYTFTLSFVNYPAKGYTPPECGTTKNKSCMQTIADGNGVVNVYFPQLIVQKITEEWAYDEMKLFMDITNAVGLFIGMGIISAVEILFMPILFLCACFPHCVHEEEESEDKKPSAEEAKETPIGSTSV